MIGHEAYVEDWMGDYGIPAPGPGYDITITETHYVEERYYEQNRERSELEEIGRPETTSWTAKDIFEIDEELSSYRWMEGDEEHLTSELEEHPDSINGKAHYVQYEAEVSRVDGDMLTPNELETIYEGVGVALPPRSASYKEGKLNTAKKDDDGVWDLPPGWTEQSAKDFWKGMGGSVTKCVEKLEDEEEIKDAGAFCASLADRIEGTAWRHEPREASTEDLLDFVHDTGKLLTTGSLDGEDLEDFSNAICVAMAELEVRGSAEFGEQALEEAGLVTAGWWGEGPLSGDGPLDLMGDLEELPPATAYQVLKREMRKGSDPYGAMGVWHLILKTGPSSYASEMEKLQGLVAKTARRLMTDKDFLASWYHEEGLSKSSTLGKWLSYFSGRGKEPRPDYQGKFKVKADDSWYIDESYADTDGDSVTVSLTLRNDYQGEELEEELYINLSADVGNLDTAETENYGGKGASQQSVVVTVHGEDQRDEPASWDLQIDVDAETGEWSYDESEWGEA